MAAEPVSTPIRYLCWRILSRFRMLRRKSLPVPQVDDSHHSLRFSEELAKWTREDFVKAGLSLDAPHVVETDAMPFPLSAPVTMRVSVGVVATYIFLVAPSIPFAIRAYFPTPLGLTNGQYEGTLLYSSVENLRLTKRLKVKPGPQSLKVLLADAQGQPTGYCNFPLPSTSV